MRLLPIRTAPALLAALLAFASAGLAQQAKPALTLEAVKVEPASQGVLGPETLCALAVTVRNAGARRISALELAVKVNGQEIQAYTGRLFLQPVEPGTSREVRLFKLWSTEAGRPAPADGKLRVEVTLARASWVDKEAKDGAEVWTLAGPVEGLPATKSVILPLKK